MSESQFPQLELHKVSENTASDSACLYMLCAMIALLSMIAVPCVKFAELRPLLLRGCS